MCNWCEKETYMTPQVCGTTFPMICEHCGGEVARLNWKELFLWKKGELSLSRLLKLRQNKLTEVTDKGKGND